MLSILRIFFEMFCLFVSLIHLKVFLAQLGINIIFMHVNPSRRSLIRLSLVISDWKSSHEDATRTSVFTLAQSWQWKQSITFYP